ncbi:MAG TPA: response regulator [Candidatus Saccharimonadales bacterium]|nr:response regulator [Candidatus Saccharimonadales bacterium]
MNFDKTILLVEDNRDDVFIFKKTLKKAQINNPVNVVANGQEAVDYLSGVNKYSDREKYPLPCVIFLDLKMPYFDGFEVLAWLRAQPSLQSINAVVLSSSDEPNDHQRAYALGTRSYLVKPPRPEEIRRFIVSMGGDGDPVDQV